MADDETTTPLVPERRAPTALQLRSYVTEVLALLATDAGMEASAYRLALRDDLEVKLAGYAGAGVARAALEVEGEAACLRALMVVRDRVEDATREVARDVLREAGLDAPEGAVVSLVVLQVYDPRARELSEIFTGAVASRAHDALSRALSQVGPTAAESIAAAHAPADVELRPFAVTAFRRVVDVVRDPAAEVSRAELESLGASDDFALGEEAGVFDPRATIALLGAVARALWATEGVGALDAWLLPKGRARART